MSLDKQQPLVSIITVVFNGDKYLQQTIDSVVNQSYKNIEYIIIDGGSTDRTLEIIEANKKHVAKWISEEDNGLYDAMNKGIDIADGELIGMINSDDWYELDAVDIVVDAYLSNPHKKIFHADRYDTDMNEDRILRRFHPSVFKFKYYAMTYNHPSMFIKNEEYQIHKYNTKLNVLSDYQFILEAFLRDKLIFYYINKPIVNFRVGGCSAQLSESERLYEGFVARKEAGLDLLSNIFSLKVRFLIGIIQRIKRI